MLNGRQGSKGYGAVAGSWSHVAPRTAHEPYCPCDPYELYLAVMMWNPRRFRCQQASFSSEQAGCSLPLLIVVMRSAGTPRLTRYSFTAAARRSPSARLYSDGTARVGVAFDGEPH